MNIFANCLCGILILIFFVTTSSLQNPEGEEGDEGFLNATCNEARDCYVLDDVNHGLWLACWYNVHKCKCQNTIRSNFYLKWENKQCLMSKYGPCGEKGEGLAVGCQDGFICINNECRDPQEPKTVKLTPFVFENSNCSSGDCTFSEDLSLTCSYSEDRCSCEKVYIADGRDTYWDIRNYDGYNNCSVGKFGPCGTKNGITIECHGNGISCVSGTCVNPNHPISDVGEDCASVKNCKEGLLCSLDAVCIEPFSLAKNKICNSDNECQKGLQCRRSLGAGPWSNAFCMETTVEKENL